MITTLQIRMAMTAFDMTNADLGEIVGVAGQTIGNFVSGRRKGTSSDTINKIERYFMSRGVSFISAEGSSFRGGEGIRVDKNVA